MTDTTKNKTFERIAFWPAMLLGAIAILVMASMPLWEAPQEDSSVMQWVEFLGEFHPLFLHLPIGAMMLVVVMEALGVLSFGKYSPKSTLGLAFASGTTVFAVLFGYFWVYAGQAEGDIIDAHQRDGTIFAVMLIATFMYRYWLELREPSKRLHLLYLIALAGTVGMMMSAGHYGGMSVHGDPMDKAPWIKDDSVEIELSDEDITNPVVFTHLVTPILEENCYKCHNDLKQNGGLRLDSYEAIVAGGDSMVDETLVPGDAEKSALISYLHLPEDDELRMPPIEENNQLNEEEIALLTVWVQSGADPEVRASDLIDSTETSEEAEQVLTGAVAEFVPPEELARIEAEKKAEEERVRRELAAQKNELNQLLNEVEKDPNLRGSLYYVSKESADMVLSAVALRERFTDESLGKYAAGIENIVEVDLRATSVTEAGLQNLTQFSKLRRLKLAQVAVSDAILDVVAKVEQLEELNLFGTGVTDEGMKKLYEMPNLRTVFVGNTAVTKEGAKALEAELIKHWEALPAEERGPKPEVIR